jgi:hypothetical protein
MSIKYPQLHMRLAGEDGNAYSIMGRLTRVLRRGGVSQEEIKAVMDNMTSSNYEHLLQVAMETVTCDSDEFDD